MNNSADPCDDFYQFACGGFLNKTVVKSDEIKVNTFSEISDRVTSQLKTLLEKDSTTQDTKPFVLVRNFYRACINETAIETAGLEPLQKMISKLGGWLDTKDIHDMLRKGKKYNWTTDLKLLRENGYSTNILLELKVAQDWKNSSQSSFFLNRPKFGLKRDFLVNGRGDKRVEVQNEDNVIVSEPSYVKNLYGLMFDSSLEVVKDYVRWRVIESSIPNLNAAAQNISEAFSNNLYGTSSKQSIETTCIQLVSNKLKHAVGAMYVNKTDWVKNGKGVIVNAFYSGLNNALVLPAAILQGLVFSADRPNYLNLGAIGWIIGHEITHGFDNKGQKFDKDGDLVNWWDNNTKKNFSERAECFVEQYGNFTIKSVNKTIDGELTLGENIADNGGIREAYQAYRNYIIIILNYINIFICFIYFS
ncbi:neprilysin-2 [Lepeophtheirus salmonis]|uniref:neprilysin-2 n=1 Tax=Lepeophtheirus salmonis TaxID=72036 RepID=UPI003AF35350